MSIAEKIIGTIAEAEQFFAGLASTLTLGALGQQFGEFSLNKVKNASQEEVIEIINKTKQRAADDQEKIRLAQLMDITEKTKKAVEEIISGLTKNLDFELATRNQPKDLSGKELDGKWEVINIYRKTQKGTKSLLGYGVLYQITPENKAIKTKDEDPIENELRRIFSAGMASAITTAPPTPTAPPQPQTTPSAVSTPPPATITPPAPLPTPQPTISSQTEAQQIQAGTLRPYLRFGGDYNLVFARLNGRQIPIDEFQSGDYFNKQLVEDHPLTDLPKYGFGGTHTVTTAPMTLPPNTAPTTMPNQPLYVRYSGSPNVFNRLTGKWISPEQAPALGVFNSGAVQDIPTPRPEVKTGSDFAIYNNRDLTRYPI